MDLVRTISAAPPMGPPPSAARTGGIVAMQAPRKPLLLPQPQASQPRPRVSQKAPAVAKPVVNEKKRGKDEVQFASDDEEEEEEAAEPEEEEEPVEEAEDDAFEPEDGASSAAGHRFHPSRLTMAAAEAQPPARKKHSKKKHKPSLVPESTLLNLAVTTPRPAELANAVAMYKPPAKGRGAGRSKQVQADLAARALLRTYVARMAYLALGPNWDLCCEAYELVEEVLDRVICNQMQCLQDDSRLEATSCNAHEARRKNPDCVDYIQAVYDLLYRTNKVLDVDELENIRDNCDQLCHDILMRFQAITLLNPNSRRKTDKIVVRGHDTAMVRFSLTPVSWMNLYSYKFRAVLPHLVMLSDDTLPDPSASSASSSGGAPGGL